MTPPSFKSIGAIALTLSAGSLLNAETVTDPVGVVKMNINAATSASQPTFTFLSTSMSQKVAYQGVVNSGGTGTVTITGADWTTNQFATAASNPSHYIIVASGPNEGELIDIVSNDGDTLTLDSTEDQNVLSTHSIRIYKHNTIASIFGADPGAGTVQKGDFDTADHISIYNPTTAQYSTYYFNTSVNTGFGDPFLIDWVKSTDLTTSAANTVIYPDDGFVYKRVTTSGFSVSVSGQVLVSQLKLPVINGYNLVTVPYPVDKSITLETSKLRPDTGSGESFDANKHLFEGDGDTADKVLIYDALSKTFKTYYFNNATNTGFGDPFIQGWVQSTDLTTDASNTSIPAGAGIFILRQAGRPAFNWVFDPVMQ